MRPIPAHEQRVDVARRALQEQARGARLLFDKLAGGAGEIGTDVGALAAQRDRVAGIVEHGGQRPAVGAVDAQDGDARVEGAGWVLAQDDLPTGGALPAVDPDARLALPEAEPAGPQIRAG